MEERLSIKTRLWRSLIFLGCLLLFLQCYYGLEVHYNPLARYPYGTEEQRNLIESVLSDEEIDYLITSQMDPDIFLPFIQSDSFNIRNAYYYQAAMQSRSAQPDIIVDFVNHYRNKWSLVQMENYLRYYSYNDIADYYDSKQKTKLVENPEDLLLDLSDGKSVWTYTPSNLRMDGSLILNQEAMNAWTAMKAAAAAEGIDLQAEAGYISYRQQREAGSASPYPNSRNQPYGTREEQLGYTLVLEPAKRAAAIIPASDVETEQPVSDMNEQDRLQAEWLKAHASDYGFIIRYPEGKEKETGQNAQPFVLRYAGIPAASEMKNQNLTLEEYNRILNPEE